MPSPVIPLAWRLPNPPTLLVGREADAAWLASAIRQAPVTVLCGPAGVGKTSLLLFTLHKAFARRVDAMRYVRLGPERPAEAALQALSAGDPQRRDDWSALLGDPHALPAAALDLAEGKEAWTVLDAGPDADTAALEALVTLLARYARRSRWIVALRPTPAEGDILRGQVATLGPLSDDDLRALARRLAPKADEPWLEVALAAAGGAPGWLRHALSLERSVGSDPRQLKARLHADLLSGLSPAERAALEMLSVAEVPVPLALLDAAPAALPRQLLADGALEPWPGDAVQVAPILRAQIAAVLPNAARQAACRAVARGLAAVGAPLTPPQRFEAVRLLVEGGFAEEAAARLATEADALLDAGYARRLWTLLEMHTAPALSRWRLRAAVEASAVTAGREMLAPSDADPWAQLDWVRYLASRGDLGSAGALAERLVSQAGDDAALWAEAASQAARCAMNTGRYAHALTFLDRLPAPDLVAQALAITARAVLGQSEALGQARALLAAARARPGAETVRARLAIAALFYRLGRLREAGDTFDSLLEDEAAAPIALRRTDLSFVQFAVRLGLGQLDEAAATLDRLRPLVGTASLFGLSCEFGLAALRLARGDLDGLDAELARLEATARDRGRPDLPCFSRSLHAELSRATAAPLVDDVPGGTMTVPYYSALESLQVARRRARLGLDHVPGDPGDHSDLRILRSVLAADAALAQGDAASAAADATAALEMARAHGLALREADALELVADAHLVRGAPRAAAESIDALAELGQGMPSARFVAEAELRRGLLSESPNWAHLERLAGQRHGAVAARRARALLGDLTVPLDAIDRRLVATVQARPGWQPPKGPRDAWVAGWGLEVATQRAWLEDGRWVDLSGKPQLWRLLLALARAGASGADKEHLQHAVWAEEEYHPLRHDNRLQAAVRNLRLALGEDEVPIRVLTLTDGYRLGGVVRRVEAPNEPPNA